MAFEGTDRFTVRRVLGEGANGVVYEAVDNETGLSVALKTLRTLSADTLFQFKQEFRSIQNLHHPNLVELFELSSAKGTWFFTMQLVEGTGVLEYVRPSSTTVTPLDTTERLTRFENLTAPGARELAPVASVSSVGGALDLARLRSCMAQVAEGLKALHDAGKVHRDIKPNNMLVTREGRVVILDFGLAAELRETARPHVDAEIAGTVAYMAPEQAAAGNVTAAADWYALGVVLFEALTGRLPFVGPAIDVLLDKQAKPAPDPRQFNPDLPAALADLTVALLATDPAARPGFGEVLAKLQTTANVEAVWASTSGTNAFVGRGKELEALNTALAHTSRGPQAVCISGESGLGKTTLVRQFIRGLERQTPAPWVCEGACYQRESVPYKGIDGALDTLATALSATDHVAARALLPPDAGLLSLSFPVLSRVQAFAEAPREEFSGIDASTLRQRLFVALRELLRRVSQTQPVVLVLDDIQWAGEDTWALLREVFRSNDGPNVLLVTTLRLESDAQGLEELVRHRHAELRGVDVTWLGLGRLSANESSALAQQLLRRLGAPLEWVDQMVLEAAGHPLLLDALARGGLDAQERTLDKLIMKRVRSLAPPAQRVLEFASMSNAPVVQHALARAAELDFGLFSKFVGGLKVLRLVRTSGSRALDTLQPFHDRVRQVVAASLSAEARRGLQERLALALESVTVPDSEALAWHWAQAGDAARAASTPNGLAAKRWSDSRSSGRPIFTSRRWPFRPTRVRSTPGSPRRWSVPGEAPKPRWRSKPLPPTRRPSKRSNIRGARPTNICAAVSSTGVAPKCVKCWPPRETACSTRRRTCSRRSSSTELRCGPAGCASRRARQAGTCVDVAARRRDVVGFRSVVDARRVARRRDADAQFAARARRG